jgi:hypothetical protein
LSAAPLAFQSQTIGTDPLFRPSIGHARLKFGLATTMDKLQQTLSSKDDAGFQSEMERRIALLKEDTAPSDVAKHNSEVNNLLAALRQGKSLIPVHFLKRYTEEIKACTISKGPGAFSFATKTALKPAPVVTQQQEAVVEAEKPIEWTLHDLADQKIEHQCNGTKVSLNDLRNCTIVIPNEAPAISLNNMTKCVVIAKNVTGSAQITACRDCRFALGVKQLRIHDSFGTDFYVSVFGNPIIEKCGQVRFAPLGEADCGPWDNVKDFDCPTTAESSPNWTVIPAGERMLPSFDA